MSSSERSNMAPSELGHSKGPDKHNTKTTNSVQELMSSTKSQSQPQTQIIKNDSQKVRIFRLR